MTMEHDVLVGVCRSFFFISLPLYFHQKTQKMGINEWKICNFSTFRLWPENISMRIYTLKRLNPHIIIISMIIMSVSMVFAICFLLEDIILLAVRCENNFFSMKMNAREAITKVSCAMWRMLNRFIEPDNQFYQLLENVPTHSVFLIEINELKLKIWFENLISDNSHTFHWINWIAGSDDSQNSFQFVIISQYRKFKRG